MTSLWKQRYLANHREREQQFQPAETFDYRRNDEFLRELRLANIRARNKSHAPPHEPPAPLAEEPMPPEISSQPALPEVSEAAEVQEQSSPQYCSPEDILEQDFPGYPAPPPVTGDLELIERLRSYFAGYLFCNDDQSTILAFWALHTHCFINFPITPYLHIASAEKQSGKTRCLQALSCVCENSWFTSGISAAVLMRKVIDDLPTVLLDDWHTAFRSSDCQGIIGFLITGHRNSSLYSAYQPQAGRVEAVPVFCPKAFSGAEPLPPALSDLCICIFLRSQKPEDQKPWRELLVMRDALPLHRYMRQWSAKHQNELSWALTFAGYAELMSELSPRQREMADILLALANTIGGEWPGKVRHALVNVLCEKKVTERDQLLLDIKAAFAASENPAHISTEELLAHLHSVEHGRWKTCSKGKPMTARRLSDKLREWKIRPGNPHKGPDSSHRGYNYSDFIELWDELLGESAS